MADLVGSSTIKRLSNSGSKVRVCFREVWRILSVNKGTVVASFRNLSRRQSTCPCRRFYIHVTR